MPIGKCSLDRFAYLVARFVNVAQAVSFVDDNKIPSRLTEVRLFCSRKLERTNNDL